MTLLHDLQTVQWNIATKIYGNNHASLIGLFTHWWVSVSPQNRWALESGPSFGYHEKGKGGGMCDALLGEGNQAVGVLEVEGTRGKYTAEKMGRFLGAELKDLRSLSFGILVLYAYCPTGRGNERVFRLAQYEETVQAVLHVSSHYPDKPIALVTIDKSYNRQQSGIRAKSEYYAGELSKVAGALYKAGQEVDSLTFYGANIA